MSRRRDQWNLKGRFLDKTWGDRFWRGEYEPLGKVASYGKEKHENGKSSRSKIAAG